MKLPQIDVVQALVELDAQDGTDRYFVQVGAHDGKTLDPVRPYVLRYGWRGLLVEPQPDLFGRLVQNYAGFAGLAFENSAVAGRDGELTLHRLFSDNYFASMLASANRDAVVHNGHGVRCPVESVTVPALTVESLLRKHGVLGIDYLFVDTEGMDGLVVADVLHAGIRPRLVRYENWGLKPLEQAALPCLAQAGYAFTLQGIDVIAARQDRWAARGLCDGQRPEVAAVSAW